MHRLRQIYKTWLTIRLVIGFRIDPKSFSTYRTRQQRIDLFMQTFILFCNFIQHNSYDKLGFKKVEISSPMAYAPVFQRFALVPTG